MPLQQNLKRIALLSIIACGLPGRSAQAGPLFDWLFFGHRQQAAPAPAYAVGYPYAVGRPVIAGYAPVVSGYAASMPVLPSYTTGYTPSVGYSALRPAISAVASAAVFPAPTAPVTLVPDYRTTVSRTPVTYYRPLLTTDATTGSQVVAMAPCSSYEYQTQRVPTMGSTQLYYGGATLPATAAVAPAVAPTVVLPRGGVALAGPALGTQPYATAYGTYPPATSYIAPAVPAYATAPTVTNPYSAGYSAYASNPANYSALQPAIAAAPGATYPTAPSGGCTGSVGTAYYGGSTGSASTSYYGSGSTGGGSTGSYVGPSQPMTTIPGGTPYSQSPYGATPSVPSAVMPPTYPGAGPVLPPVTGSSSDPAASQQPILPMQGTGARLESKPQLQSVVQQPIPGARSTAAAPSAAPARDAKPNAGPRPGLLPIPVPEDFKHEPRWNPGLLNEQDQTAAKGIGQPATTATPSAEDPGVAWGSKTIHWASFKEPADAPRSLETVNASEAKELTLKAPQSRLRDVRVGSGSLSNAAAASSPRPNAIVQPRAGDAASAQTQVVVPSHVQMIPLEEALRQASPAPSAQPPADGGSHLMLSPSSGALSIEPAPTALAAPTNIAPVNRSPDRSRYSTEGWQRAR